MSVSFLAKKLELAFGGGLDFGDVGSELAEAEQLAGGEEFVADGAAAGGVYGTDDGLAIFVDDREDVVVRDGLVIEEVGAVAGNDDLGVAGSGGQSVTKDAGRPGVQGDFGLFDANEGNFLASTAVGGLQESGNDAEGAQRAVGHVLCEEAPRGLIFADLLAELKGFLFADVAGGDIDDAWHHFGKQLNHLVFSTGTVNAKEIQNAGEVAAVAKQDFAGVRGLKIANLVGVEIVKAHASQAIVQRAELGQAGSRDQKEAVISGRGKGFGIGILDLAGIDHVEIILL
jgi:hypothetical protein